MEQALALQHVDIANARQVGVLFKPFAYAKRFICLALIGGDIAAKLAHERSGAQAGYTHGMLILMLMHAFNGLAYHNEVVQLGERGVIRARTRHVYYAFLEADYRAGGHYGHAAQDMGLTAAYGIDLGDDAGELAARAFYLNARLDNVLDRGNANAFARLCDIKAHRLNTSLNVVVLIYELLHGIGVDEKRSVFNFGFV